MANQPERQFPRSPPRHHCLNDCQPAIRAESSEEKECGGRSEFPNGSFLRTITLLPVGASAHDVKAPMPEESSYRHPSRIRPSAVASNPYTRN